MSASVDTSQSNLEGLSFEQALANLQEIVARLESGDLTLEVTITDFQKGSALAAQCQKMITEAELRITELVDATAHEPAFRESASEEVPF